MKRIIPTLALVATFGLAAAQNKIMAPSGGGQDIPPVDNRIHFNAGISGIYFEKKLTQNPAGPGLQQLRAGILNTGINRHEISVLLTGAEVAKQMYSAFDAPRFVLGVNGVYNKGNAEFAPVIGYDLSRKGFIAGADMTMPLSRKDTALFLDGGLFLTSSDKAYVPSQAYVQVVKKLKDAPADNVTVGVQFAGKEAEDKNFVRLSGDAEKKLTTIRWRGASRDVTAGGGVYTQTVAKGLSAGLQGGIGLGFNRNANRLELKLGYGLKEKFTAGLGWKRNIERAYHPAPRRYKF